MSDKTIASYNAAQSDCDRDICTTLQALIDHALPEAESKIWHAHPVWFLAGNPIVSYGKLKDCMRLMFWSGQSFDAKGLTATGSFKAAERRYTSAADIDPSEVTSWLADAKTIQWDYKNIQKRKGRLERLD